MTDVDSNHKRKVEKEESEAAEGCWENIGLEPVVFILNIVTQITFITSQDLMMEKACRVSTRWIKVIIWYPATQATSTKGMQELLQKKLIQYSCRSRNRQ